MQYAKKVIASMPKAYAIGMFEGADAKSFVIGVEKDGPSVASPSTARRWRP